MYVEPSAETILEPGTKIGDLYRRNMTRPYVLQRLSERAWWVQAFNYGTVFYVGEDGVLILDTLEGVYDNITQAVASVTDEPIVAVVYPHYHADHIGDIDKYVAAAREQGSTSRSTRVPRRGSRWIWRAAPFRGRLGRSPGRAAVSTSAA